MTTEIDELAALLERATELEAKAVTTAAELEDDELTPDAREDLEAQRQAALLGLPELEARIEELQDQVQLLAAGDDEPADADDWEDDDTVWDDAGVDFDELDEPVLTGALGGDEAKAAGWLPCLDCGGTGVEAAGDGAVCEDCGTPLVRGETKGVDFDEPDDDDELGDVVSLEPIDEMELLRARRAALGN